MPMFLNYGSGAIPGDSTSTGHEQWIEISSFQWGVGRGITAASASEADRESATPSVSEIVVTKNADSASNNLLRAALGYGPGGTGQTVQIDFAMTGTSGQPTVYLSYTLQNTLVSGYSTSSGGDRPSESLTLNFTDVSVTTTPAGASNTSTGPDTAEYNLATQSKVQ